MKWEWPVWLPYPRAIGSSLVTIISFSLAFSVAYGVTLISSIPYGVMNYLSNIFENLTTPMGWILVGWAFLVFIVLPIFLVAHLHQALYTLHSIPKKRAIDWQWIPSNKFQTWATRDFLIFVFVFSSVAIFLDVNPSESDEEGEIALVLVMILMSYVYHVRIVISQQLEKQRRDSNRRHNRQSLPKMKFKPNPTVTTKTPDIDKELDRLKGELRDKNH